MTIDKNNNSVKCVVLILIFIHSWIPAFAGMTDFFEGPSEVDEGYNAFVKARRVWDVKFE
jgi:hypothetical protein